MKALLLNMLIILAMSSCKTAKTPDIQGRAKAQEMNPVASKTVLLSGSAEILPPVEVNSFQATDEKMFLLDSVRTQQAYIYNLDGSLDKLVGAPGQGPGEYRGPGGFCLSGDRLHLISAGRKYILYDQDGNLIRTNLEIHRGGIGNKIYPGPNDTAFFTMYSRHVPNASIFQVNNNSDLVHEFSPPDKAFNSFWDMVHPMGNLVITDDAIYQMFIHRYEVLVFDLQGIEKKRINLASNIYKTPDYDEAANLKEDAAVYQRFMKKYSIIRGFYKTPDGYVTSITNTTRSNEYEVLEFWDSTFNGLGRWDVPQDETLVGNTQESLVFYNSDNRELVFRSF